jgi:short subunit dehydrogenase-like uncharacterized protein
MSERASDFVLYGSTGYVGRAVAELAVEQGLRPLLAGRNHSTVTQQASHLGLEARVFDLDGSTALDAALAGVPVVLNCAGPYLSTYRPIVDACLRSGTHYLDITGEPPVYEAIAARDKAATSNGVMLLPGVGFDVVPTDCLAAHLKQRLPTATHLTLAFYPQGPAALPPGTLKTLIDLIPQGSNKQRRSNGRIEVVPGARKTRMIDFGSGPVQASMLTWGDVYLAYRSTGIPNIEDYTVLPAAMARQMDVTERMRSVFRIAAIRNLAKLTLRGGATPEERAQTTMSVWGEVVDADGQKAVSRMHGPEGGLVWTSRSALEAVKRVVAGDFKPGFQTPSLAYGPDFALACEGVTREDIE